jgi:hypothetical protein
MDFATILSRINTGAQIAQAVTPAIQQYGTDHVAATQQILQIAGAGRGGRNQRQDSADRGIGFSAVGVQHSAAGVRTVLLLQEQQGSAGEGLRVVLHSAATQADRPGSRRCPAWFAAGLQQPLVDTLGLLAATPPLCHSVR